MVEVGIGNEEEMGEKRRRERRNRTKRRLLKEDVRFLFLWKFLIFFSQGRDLEGCGDLSWEDFLDKAEDLSDRESKAWAVVPEVPDVVAVLVSPSSGGD